MSSGGVRVQISFSFSCVVATGVGVATALLPTAAVSLSVATGKRATPDAVCPPLSIMARASQLPVDGMLVSSEYRPGRGLSGEWSPVWPYPVNGYHVAGNGPSAFADAAWAR